MKLTSVLLISSLSVALAACGGAPKKIPALEEARASYQAASANSDIVRFAPEELDAAKTALVKADRSWKRNVDKAITIQHANVVSKRVDVARLIAQRNQADQQLESMAGERQQAQLNIRSKELDRDRALLEKERIAAEQARDEAAELKRQMAELQAEATERGMVLTLGDVLFDVNEASLKPGAMHNIDKIADFMQNHPEKTVQIEGHTDSMGDDGYNKQLSEARANAVRLALLERGVSGQRVSTQGFGEALPVASNDDRSGRQQNRRVEVIFPNDKANVVEAYGQ